VYFWEKKLFLGKNSTKVENHIRNKKKEKQELVIDFMDSTLIDPSKLFAKSSKSINISRSSDKNKLARNNLLPEDMHFSSKDLLRLFLKPKCFITFRKPSYKTSSVEHGNKIL